MIISNNKKENEMLLNINNDIYRIVKGLNEIEDFKRLLICTDYNTSNEKDLSIDLIDKIIVRTPLVPNTDTSTCVVTLNQAIPKRDTYYIELNIDIYTPFNQWLVKEGVRPMLLCNCVKNFMRGLTQTNGVRYRLKGVSNCSIGSDLKGYRLLYHTIIDK